MALSDDEITTVTQLLGKLEPGFLPLPIFLEVARLTVTSTLELVPLRLRGDVVEVLLVKRPPDDPHWAGLPHTPGTVLRATDPPDGLATALQRLLGKELPGLTLASEPVFLKHLFHQVRRGVENTLVFFAEVDGEPTEGEFCPVGQLPPDLVDTQVDFIKEAAAAYQAQKTGN